MKTILFGFILTPFLFGEPTGHNGEVQIVRVMHQKESTIQVFGPLKRISCGKQIYPVVDILHQYMTEKTSGLLLLLETPASEEEKKERLKQNNGLPTVTVLSKVSLQASKSTLQRERY